MANPIHRPDYQVFRVMLLEARKAKGLQQEQVAEQIGRMQSFVSKYERGERRLDFPEFVIIADALGIDITAFVAEYRKRVVER